MTDRQETVEGLVDREAASLENRCDWIDYGEPTLELIRPLTAEWRDLARAAHKLAESHKRLRLREAELTEALDRMVPLHAHYAELLNMHDGGERIVFKTKEEWIARLASLKEQFPLGAALSPAPPESPGTEG